MLPVSIVNLQGFHEWVGPSIYNCELSLSLNAKTIFLLVDPGLAWEFDREMLGMMIPRSLEKLI